ncbi:hypothetical protein ACVIWV_004939 [Bradyrhizobium diazoefficiens]
MASNVNPDPFTTRPEIEGTFGVVATTHWIATAVGMAILEKGGNAFDAGVATAFTLQVVEPHLNGPGGDVPVIVHDVKRGRTEVICGQGPAPARATIAHYRSEGLDMVPGTGLLAACVPGTFESWMMLLRDYGTMRVRDVLEPAISYARDGYPLVERACATIQTVEQLFRKHWPTSAAVYLPNGEVPKPGALFTNKTLAATYARILSEAESGDGGRDAEIERARRAWSHGFVAEAIDKFCRTQEVMDVSGSPHRGVLSADDMARWQPTIEAPLTYDYGRYTVCKAGVWSQGPVTLQQLALLKGFALDGLDPTGPEFIHLQIECAKLAFADREKFYGDPKFSEIPIATLLSDAYNDERRKLVTDKASLDFRPGSVEGFGRCRQAAARRRPARSGRRARRRRADGRTLRRGTRRHRAFRHHRQGRQYGLLDAIGRLAAIFADHSGARLLPRQPRADVLAGGRPSRRACAGQAAAHHAVADHGAARRRAVSRLGLAGRRPAGPMDHAILPAPRPLQSQPSGIDRRTGLAFRAFPDLVLAAHRAPRRARGREPRTEGNDRESARARTYHRDRVRLVGRPPHRGLARRGTPPRRRQSARHARLRSRTLMDRI